MTLRRPTNRIGSNATTTPLGAGGIQRHCMTCNKWRSPAGGDKHRGMWRCCGCKTMATLPALRSAA